MLSFQREIHNGILSCGSDTSEWTNRSIAEFAKSAEGILATSPNSCAFAYGIVPPDSVHALRR